MHPRTEMKERKLFIWVSFSIFPPISSVYPIFLSFFHWIGREEGRRRKGEMKRERKRRRKFKERK